MKKALRVITIVAVMLLMLDGAIWVIAEVQAQLLSPMGIPDVFGMTVMIFLAGAAVIYSGLPEWLLALAMEWLSWP